MAKSMEINTSAVIMRNRLIAPHLVYATGVEGVEKGWPARAGLPDCALELITDAELNRSSEYRAVVGRDETARIAFRRVMPIGEVLSAQLQIVVPGCADPHAGIDRRIGVEEESIGRVGGPGADVVDGTVEVGRPVARQEIVAGRQHDA